MKIEIFDVKDTNSNNRKKNIKKRWKQYKFAYNR